MCLNIFTKFVFAVMSVFQLPSGDHSSWTHAVGYPMVRGECIEPKHCALYHFDDESRGNYLEWESVICRSNSFLHCPDVSLDLWDVFVPGSCVETYISSIEIFSQMLKFTVHHGCVNSVSPTMVYAKNSADGLCDGFAFLVGQCFNGAELYVS